MVDNGSEVDNMDSDNKAGSKDNKDNGEMGNDGMVVLDNNKIVVSHQDYILLVTNRLPQYLNFEIAKYYLLE